PNLEMLAPDRGTEPGDQRLGREAGPPDGRLEDARGEPAPAGVRAGDRTAVLRGEQHRQAVGDLDDGDAPGTAGDDGVRRARSAAIARVRIEDLRAVDLLDPRGLLRQREGGAHALAGLAHRPGPLAPP